MNAPMSIRVRQIVSQLTLDTDPYLSCDECFETLDEAAEEFVLGTGTLTTRRFQTHLLGCAACREEAWVLAELVADEAGLDPTSQQTRIEHAVSGPTRDR